MHHPATKSAIQLYRMAWLSAVLLMVFSHVFPPLSCLAVLPVLAITLSQASCLLAGDAPARGSLTFSFLCHLLFAGALGVLSLSTMTLWIPFVNILGALAAVAGLLAALGMLFLCGFANTLYLANLSKAAGRGDLASSFVLLAVVPFALFAVGTLASLVLPPLHLVTPVLYGLMSLVTYALFWVRLGQLSDSL